MTDLQITVWCESIKPGCEFFALLVAGPNRVRYGGSGSTAWEAIAWCLDEYVSRGVLGLPVSMTRHPKGKPGDRARDHLSSQTPAPGVGLGAGVG